MSYTVISPPKKVSDWQGCLVRSKRILTNGLGQMPADTIFEITSSGITKYLQTLGCECCGLKFRISTKDRKDDFLEMFDFVEEA